MPQIHLNKELLSKELFADVRFIVFSYASAMGSGGAVRFITGDKTEFFFNYTTDDLRCSQVEEVFLPLSQFKTASPPFDGWHRIYLGVGTSIAVRDDVFPLFEQYAREYTSDNYGLFQNWRRIVLSVLNG